MMLFQRRLFGELLRNTLTTLALLTAVLMLIISAQVMQQQGLTLLTLVRAVPIFAATQIDITLPMAVLVAVVLTYGRAAADNEVETLRASGVHPFHVALPGLVFGGLLSVLLLLGVDYVKPLSEAAKLRIANETDIASLLHDKLSSGEPVSLDARTVLSAESFDENGQARGLRVQIYDEQRNLEREIVASAAEISLNNAAALIEVRLRDFHAVKGAAMTGADALITRPVPRDVVDLGHGELTTPQLMAFVRRGPDQRASFTPRRAELDVDMRLASAAACLLFVVLGLPVALLFRRHDRTAAFLVAFLAALFVYYPCREITQVLSERDILPPAAASWTGNAFIAAVGLGLAWKVFRR